MKQVVIVFLQARQESGSEIVVPYKIDLVM